MKTYLIIVFVGILLCGCNVTKNMNFSGHYVSHCHVLGFPELVADFNKDSTFYYKHSHSPDVIVGKWEIKDDTLFLFSDIFEKRTVSLSNELADITDANPVTKDLLEAYNNGQYTEADKVDMYLIRGKRLYKFTKTGFTKDCPLIRVKK